MKRVRIGLLGLGVVGTGVVQLIERNGAALRERTGLDLVVEKALVKQRGKPRPLADDRIVYDPAAILDDPAVDVVIEVIAGAEAARNYLLRALEAGKPVVTANKAALAAYGDDVFAAAHRAGRAVGFEAAVCGGVPIIRALTGGLVADRLGEVRGIFNGTTNYILTRMAEDGQGYGDALAAAQARGFAEADPTADVSGRDAANKLAILAGLAFQSAYKPDDFIVEGITSLEAADFRWAAAFGYTIKLIATAREAGAGALDLRVHPTLVPAKHPFAGVRDEFNAVRLNGDAVGDMMLYGKGAGAFPTASAVVSDVIEIVRNPPPPDFWNPAHRRRPRLVDPVSEHYLRFPVFDRPGIIGEIAADLGKEGVSIRRVEADLDADASGRGTVVMLTHAAPDTAVRAALSNIAAADVLAGPPRAIRLFA